MNNHPAFIRPSEDAPAPAEKATASEIIQSLTGFEEIAIEQVMRIDPYSQAEQKPVAVLRALVFVMRKRAGADDKAAREAAMSMPLSEVQELFADEEPELDPEAPVTASGEGSAPSA